MRRPRGKSLGLVLLTLATLGTCKGAPEGKVEVPGREGAVKTAALERAERRAYDGAPPVIPHENFGMECVACHDLEGMAVEGVGYAPPSPHEGTMGLSAVARCRQCHVFSRTEAVFAANRFEGRPQDLRKGDRLSSWAPPRMPHPVFMRESCVACHTGPAAREEIRTTHPERVRCGQCHVAIESRETFEPVVSPPA